MPYFINFRSHAVGGWIDTSSTVKLQLSPPATADGFNQPSSDPSRFAEAVRDRQVLIGTHGFNVDFAGGVTSLSYWSSLLHLPDSAVFVGVLWPGDSVWAHGLDYPEEPRVADDAGERLAAFIESAMGEAADISFVSHSLGARVVLQAASHMTRRTRRITLMAGAIDDNCLLSEFKSVVQRTDRISVLASRRDEVLALAFPLGNLLGGILDKGHPWWHSALGRDGPARPLPGNLEAPFAIPHNWGYGHHHYLQHDPPYAGPDVSEVTIPVDNSPDPLLDGEKKPFDGWQEAWSAAFVSTRFK